MSFEFKIRKCKRNLAKHKNRTVKGFCKNRKHYSFGLNIKNFKIVRDASVGWAVQWVLVQGIPAWRGA